MHAGRCGCGGLIKSWLGCAGEDWCDEWGRFVVGDVMGCVEGVRGKGEGRNGKR